MPHAHLLIGLNSGTSADGIDAVLVRVTGIAGETRIRERAFLHVPYPRGLREHLIANSAPGCSSVDEICRLNALLAGLFAEAAQHVARKAKVPLAKVDVIGSHGQTVHHLPRGQTMFGRTARSTLQLGDPTMIAALTGVPTVGNFRSADIALGGEGAPLVAFLDAVLFRSERKNRMLLNLGGIANITILPRNALRDDVRAFDTGPANIIIDALMTEGYHKSFDRLGTVAGSGMVAHDLLRWMMEHPFLRRRPPKSTGREEFGAEFLGALRNRARGIAREDIIATATEFTALSVYDQYVRFVRRSVPVDELLVSGGGMKNRTLMGSLRRHFAPIPVRPIGHPGFSPEAKEAVLFAVLAHETMHGMPSSLPSVTGASRPAVLGSLSFG
jgi:anhydro-N-acetylmuramic acid kinase